MKYLFTILIAFAFLTAQAQISFTTEKFYIGRKKCCKVHFEPTKGNRLVIKLSPTGDTVLVGSYLFVFVNKRSCYVDEEGKETGLYYWSGLNGSFVISVENEEKIVFFQHGKLSELDGGWVSLYTFLPYPLDQGQNAKGL